MEPCFWDANDPHRNCYWSECAAIRSGFGAWDSWYSGSALALAMGTNGLMGIANTRLSISHVAGICARVALGVPSIALVRLEIYPVLHVWNGAYGFAHK